MVPQNKLHPILFFLALSGMTFSNPPALAENNSSKIRGKILAVQKNIHSVVLDIGKEDGVRIGQRFTVYENNSSIASLKVSEIYAKMSVAEIENKKHPLKDGDTVVARRPKTNKKNRLPKHPKSKTLGRILAIEYLAPVVLIDLGKKDGLYPGKELSISREDEWVAIVVAKKVMDKLSIGTVYLKKSPVRIGDRIVLLNE